MFELERAIRRWRRNLERRSSLAPREVDELEDHLRARVDLELELNAALTPARAFATASVGLGGAEHLSREFAKAGKPKWRRLLGAGLILFGLSFLLPVDGPVWALAPRADWTPGFDAFLSALLFWGNPFEFLSPLTNVLVVVTVVMLVRGTPPKGRWLIGLLTGAVAVNLYWAAWLIPDGQNPLVELGVGYWTWLGSFGCLAAALWLRECDWVSAPVEEVVK